MKSLLRLALGLSLLCGSVAFSQTPPSPGVTGGSGKPAGTAFSIQYRNGSSFAGTGPGTSGQVLTSNGPGVAPTFQAGGGSGCTLANPTAVIGLTAVNGVAATCMRSDAAPALDQGITPTWTGAHTFSATATGTLATGGSAASFVSSSASPSIGWSETDQGTNGKNWDLLANGAVWQLRTLTDANATPKVAFSVTRTAASTTISNMTFGNATDASSYTFASTGVATWSGVMTSPGYGLPASTTLVTNGMYRPAANTVGFATNSVLRVSIDATGNLLATSGYFSGGTKFTTTGCSVSSTTGGATGGTLTLGANTCSVVITLGGASGSTAPNGWTCAAHDRTSPTTQIGGESSSTATTATISIPAGAGATDVISFSCTGY